MLSGNKRRRAAKNGADGRGRATAGPAAAAAAAPQQPTEAMEALLAVAAQSQAADYMPDDGTNRCAQIPAIAPSPLAPSAAAQSASARAASPLRSPSPISVATVASAASASSIACSCSTVAALPAAASAVSSVAALARRDQRAGCEQSGATRAGADQSATDASSAPVAFSLSVNYLADRSAELLLELIMRMMEAEDLAALGATCRSWRHRLQHAPPSGDGLELTQSRSLLQLSNMASCTWVRPLITQLEVTVVATDKTFSLAAGGVAARRTIQQDMCNSLLSVLGHFSRVHTLILPLCDNITAAFDWRLCFTALSGRLRRLTLLPKGDEQVALVHFPLAHIAQLRQLECLTVVLGRGLGAWQVSLAQLPLLPRLASVELKQSLIAREGQLRSIPFRCTSKQIDWLLQCKQLTSIDCGSWPADEGELDDEGGQLPSAGRQIDRSVGSIARLVRGLTLQPAAAAASTSASSVAPPASTASFCRLQFLDLSSTVMSAAVWAHVSQLPSLTQLEPDHWRGDIPPQLWKRLANFTRLQSVTIHSSLDDDCFSTPLLTADFLPPLLRCRRLQRVSLDGNNLELSVAQLHGIARLPELRVLLLHWVGIESAEPLGRAVKLAHLRLQCCEGSDGDACDWRSCLPPLPSLTQLEIWDRKPITADHAAPLNAALFARMPRLIPARFVQNLLDEELGNAGIPGLVAYA